VHAQAMRHNWMAWGMSWAPFSE